MAYQTIVVGIDSSQPAMAAARAGRDLVARTGGRCHFVHATFDVSDIPAVVPPDIDVASLAERVSQAERDGMAECLRRAVGEFDPADLTVRIGTPRWVLNQVAHELDADLVVIGGKRHPAIARWLGGSTAHHALQTIDRPILVVHPDRPMTGRIMAAVDLSPGSRDVLSAAEDLTRSVEGELRVVHAIEPLPWMSNQMTVFNHAAFMEWSEVEFDGLVRDLTVRTQPALHRGEAEMVIGMECEEWHPGVLVVGSRGKGLVDRMLLGSTAHRLLTHLPASLLVVPVGASVGRKGAADLKTTEGAVLG